MKKSITQALNIIRQERLFSSIYIIGTGLSITMVMSLSIVFYLKIADIYPETNRSRMLLVKSGTEKAADGGFYASSLALHTIETCFNNIENVEAITAIHQTWNDGCYIQLPNSKEQPPVTVKYIDDNFWTVFPFHYIEGKPFTKEDFRSSLPVAVITRSLANKIFGTTDVVGREVSMNFRNFRICGIVRDASFITERTFAHIYLPYTVLPNWEHAAAPEKTLGAYQACILARTASDIPKIKQTILENVSKYNQTLKAEFSIVGQPDSQWQSTFRLGGNHAPDFTKIIIQYTLIFFILLLVPAVSLSGMTESRMERRMEEMGVRRAFGAPAGNIIRQVLTENLVFTAFGGALGLIFSYIIIILGRNWIMQTGSNFGNIPPEGVDTAISPSMLINLPVFSIALAVCILLNLLSAFIPAWRAARRPIVYSLNPTEN
ncbi:MAG: ABC transporter permease [Tannerellaceae bacterium]|jgi:putative ABC transport system permease protein|nr:ABC transporter permease [Tannerellaceae bacterium]